MPPYQALHGDFTAGVPIGVVHTGVIALVEPVDGDGLRHTRDHGRVKHGPRNQNVPVDMAKWADLSKPRKTQDRCENKGGCFVSYFLSPLPPPFDTIILVY